jgi:tetratricopeptide (TPR) repeat protein
MKKTLKKQIKQDELATGFERARTAAGAHSDEIKIAAIVVAVLLIGGIALTQFRSQREREARESLNDALQTFHGRVATEQVPASEMPSGPVFATRDEKFRKALSDLEGVERRYSSHPVGLRARYYAALCKMELGQNDEAETALKDIAAKKEGDRLEPALARLALAQLHVQAGHVDRAVDAYKQITDDSTFALPRDYALLSLAKLLEDQKKTAEAQAAYKRLVEEFPESAFAAEARRHVEPSPARG